MNGVIMGEVLAFEEVGGDGHGDVGEREKGEDDFHGSAEVR